MLGSPLALGQTNFTSLRVGDTVPNVKLRTEGDREVSLRKLVADKPTVIIFYRGGWCPYCNRHLQALVKIEKDLTKLGVQILAISTDQPAKLRQTPGREHLVYRLLSDADAEAARAFGIAFQVADDLVRQYKESFHIDLEAASGRTHHLLPHPAVFIADTDGKILFAHVNPDYKVRLDPVKILSAVCEVTR